MRHDTRATHFKAHLYSLECYKYTNYLTKVSHPKIMG